MSDPRETHHMDQALAAARNDARVAMRFHDELIESGASEALAARLTEALIVTVFDPSPRKEDDAP